MTSLFNTGIYVCKYFSHLMKKALTSFNNFIAPINKLLRSFKTSGSSRSSNSERTSGKINLESNEQYNHKVE